MRAPLSYDRARSGPAAAALLAGRRDGTATPAGGPSLAPAKNVRLGPVPTTNFQLAWRSAPVCAAAAHPGLGAGTRH
jgi:hypothetical protein